MAARGVANLEQGEEGGQVGKKPLRVGVYCDGRGAQRSQEKQQQNSFTNALLGSMQVVTSVVFMISVTMS